MNKIDSWCKQSPYVLIPEYINNTDQPLKKMYGREQVSQELKLFSFQQVCGDEEPVFSYANNNTLTNFSLSQKSPEKYTLNLNEDCCLGSTYLEQQISIKQTGQFGQNLVKIDGFYAPRLEFKDSFNNVPSGITLYLGESYTLKVPEMENPTNKPIRAKISGD